MMNSRYNSVSKTIGTIDITPLMDLTFMLLIIFIITVPALEFTTEVQLPGLNTPKTANEIENAVVLTLSNDGFVTLSSKHLNINDKKVIANELDVELKTILQQDPEIELLIWADGKCPYSDVISLYKKARDAGLKSVQLVTEAEDSK